MSAKVAERMGFEPTIRLLTVYPLSRRAPSTTRPPLLDPRNSRARAVRAREYPSYAVWPGAGAVCLRPSNHVAAADSRIRVDRPAPLGPFVRRVGAIRFPESKGRFLLRMDVLRLLRGRYCAVQSARAVALRAGNGRPFAGERLPFRRISTNWRSGAGGETVAFRGVIILPRRRQNGHERPVSRRFRIATVSRFDKVRLAKRGDPA